ncbi:MAG: anaerobic glycerol-3-phosphate dehydrogenase subunit C [Deltaproteobacteria bacterium HGW-Deltaproteobacteria-14]|jgi:Fe-S oxidoreductase|nr:MAG: anaerobic glycerol-3-phosphate dehydrogenase subunit C [Deltaproteobacteria bacterium HGW-Deltaproteobacteria-14]
MSAGNISYQPTDGLSYDPADPVYWDAEALGKEVTRTFEICHGCRMCFKYCDSFPKLFTAIDERHDGDVRKLEQAETAEVMDACFQCKLCEVQCPYTVRDGHEYALDFPKLVHRYRAQHVKQHGVRLRDKVLGNPDGTAKMARASLGLVNVMNRWSVHRWFLEKVLGIHKKKQLPRFAGQTFEKWAKKNGKIKPPGGEVALFQTCYVQHNEPQIGQDTVAVFEQNQVDVRCVKGLECCGMPAWESGQLETFQKHAKRNLDKLEPYVDAGAKVVAINPTCTMMLRREYPELAAPEDRERAKKLAAVVADPSEFLWGIRNEERFSTDFKSAPDNVSYHAACHLRAQAVGFKGRDILKKIPGVKPGTVMECCGHDGTYAMKVEGFEPSQRVGKKAFDGMIQQASEVWATDCPLAAIQFEQHAGVKPMHPMSILARAYRGDSFADAKSDAPDDANDLTEKTE